MNVWAIAPSIRPNGGTLPSWKAMGYKVAVLRQGEGFPEADNILWTDHYLGWAKSINILIKWVIGFDAEAQWFVIGNDDTLPDETHTPDQIAFECGRYFGEKQQQYRMEQVFSSLVDHKARMPWSTFGVMQPTGDYALWPGSNIIGFAGSPWLGRDWCKRAYGGNGPVCEDFFHNWSDQHLQEVAIKLDVFWQRDDLIHQHNHAGRSGSGWKWEPFQLCLQGKDTWDREKALFEQQRASGFAGHDPI